MNELTLLIGSAAFLGFIHTLLGPDHYLPFIVLSKARSWSQAKTMWITFISGVGHVAGSVILGIVGIALGISVSKLEAIESQRGDMVGWLIIAFGIAYSIYGIYKYLNKGGHFHLPGFLVPKNIRQLRHFTNYEPEQINENSYEHTHKHLHQNHHEHTHEVNSSEPHEHKHIHEQKNIINITPWILFLIFVFGPCEVLIPLLIFPASEFSVVGIAAVSIVFGLATILTMLSVVYLGYRGTAILKFKAGEKFLHLLAGLVILSSGLGMQFLGW